MASDLFSEFHPAVAKWFLENFQSATDCQKGAWPAIQADRDVLVAAPTGSGKTLAAFLAVLDELFQKGLSNEGLEQKTYVVYVSPLKALSYDIKRNLEFPLEGIKRELAESGYAEIEVRTAVRTGDTTQSERRSMIRRPPHIIVTTPESLYLLLTAESGRQMLRSVEKVIVDEIHSLAGNKRGAHFALSLVRLEILAGRNLTKIGLSATQKPVSQVASFLTGSAKNDCVIVDSGHIREWDLSIEIPAAQFEALMSTETWGELYQKIAGLVQAHKTTLIFVNTRRHAERATRFLAELLGEESITAHHGSLSKEHRHDAEQRLKTGDLKALVATASLELGIDIGDVNLVIQIGSPRSISVFLQRIGRSGHAVGKLPKGRIFPTTRDELVESAALLKAINDGEMECLDIAAGSLDVLAQQIVAEASVHEWKIDELYDCIKTAFTYRNLEKKQFEAIVQMLAEGFTLRQGRRSAYIHLDAVNRKIRGRRGAKVAATMNAGAIPDQFDFDVVLEPEDVRIGTVNEDFAFESMAGDIFQLGNASYRVLQVQKGVVRVEDAGGLPPNIPFWLGEGRGRSQALSHAVSELRSEVAERLDRHAMDEVIESIGQDYSLSKYAAKQIVDYLASAKMVLGVLPNRKQVVFERFFDEVGDMHLVVHSVFGSRLNRAWGLALRKRFCVRFNFELQAAALEDSLVLSLGPTHSFELEEVKNYLKQNTVRQTLTQAIFTAPMFATRWRWVCNTALAVLRNRNGKKVPPVFQRADAEDLLALVFPDQVACQENLSGPIQVPDHPLVDQTINDCLHEVMDVCELENLLGQLEAGEISVICKDLQQPSPLSAEVLTAKPYAFLDDAPAEERRTLAVQQRRSVSIEDAEKLAQLDPEIFSELRKEMQPDPKNADELHDSLLLFGYLKIDKLNEFKSANQLKSQFKVLAKNKRATEITLPNRSKIWVAAERLNELQAVVQKFDMLPVISSVSFGNQDDIEAESALVGLLRSRLEMTGPRTASSLAGELMISVDLVNDSLAVLQSEGSILKGRYEGGKSEAEWCERRFLARVHKRTLRMLRSEIAPVSSIDYSSFLVHWLRLVPDSVAEGVDALNAVLCQLEGYEAPAGQWESELLPARVFGYTPEMLDYLSASGQVVWARVSNPVNSQKQNTIYRHGANLRSVPLTFLRRESLPMWRALAKDQNNTEANLSSIACQIKETLQLQGALFYDDIVHEVNHLPSHVEQGLVELFSLGMVTCDHYGGIRNLLIPEHKRRKSARWRRFSGNSVQFSGRWSLIEKSSRKEISREEAVAYSAKVLLNRYGVVFRDVAVQEKSFFPYWNELLKIYRRMEDRGEIRGGRFVSGFSGEQFALPEAVESMRTMRHRSNSNGGSIITVSATDPLNIAGVTVSGDKIPAIAGNYLVFKNGRCISAEKNGSAKTALPLQNQEE